IPLHKYPPSKDLGRDHAGHPSPLEGPGSQIQGQPQNRAQGAGPRRPRPHLLPPHESQDGLWGGEGWISGFRYANKDKLSTRLERVWKPQLFTRELYSEILNHKLTITVTARTLYLIDATYGFDYYILREDLNSKPGMDLRRAMLLRLAFKDTQFYPEDPVKRERIYTKYKQFEIPAEEAEWLGLSVDEAVEKQRQLEHKKSSTLSLYLALTLVIFLYNHLKLNKYSKTVLK
uniref:Large ribosomal subunit protein bL28m n=1 Tax=Hucho hucho TaxID=62062 RepID=A0A4W5Q7I0_9TELE